MMEVSDDGQSKQPFQQPFYSREIDNHNQPLPLEEGQNGVDLVMGDGAISVALDFDNIGIDNSPSFPLMQPFLSPQPPGSQYQKINPDIQPHFICTDNVSHDVDCNP